ncbi:MAG: MraY family glycosyltransferase [Bacteriovorax sp.]|jgi:UDP-N-acetylmuramyl pentapeptide phosphotransferase/UDP-N-acetylglucosamine-1-phosphate transferase
MLVNFSTIFTPALFTMIQSLFVSWIFLKLICLSNPGFLSFIYISSGKSTTNARLLGGMSISASMISSISSLIIFYRHSLSQYEINTLVTAIVSILFVTFYGYIDDKFEVRVRFKLALQLISILSFAYFNAHNISPEHESLAFMFSSILGLALVNGTNLLDGLDTLSIKLGMSSSIAFLYLGIISGSSATIYLSAILISALSMFYFFNREPAKVYMGEIGGSLIGLIYFIQSSICISHFKTQMSIYNAIAMVLIAGSFPICELGVSFIRRLLCKKTPFSGDKLHLHYIIKNKYRLSASTTSTRMGVTSFLILSFGFLVAKSYNPILGLCSAVLITLQIYLWVCFEEWRSNLLIQNTENVFKIFEGKKVNIIDSTQFSSFDISLKEENRQKTSRKKSA